MSTEEVGEKSGTKFEVKGARWIITSYYIIIPIGCYLPETVDFDCPALILAGLAEISRAGWNAPPFVSPGQRPDDGTIDRSAASPLLGGGIVAAGGDVGGQAYDGPFDLSRLQGCHFEPGIK